MSKRTKTALEVEKPARRQWFSFWSSSLTALLILGAIGLWMLSGDIVIGGSDTDKVPPIAPESTASKGGVKTAANTLANKKLFTVRARRFTSRPRKEVLHIRARTEAAVQVEVRAETSGRVEKIFVRKGDVVKKGKVLCKLDEGARQASLAQARALVAQTESDYYAANKLARRGFSAKLNVNAKKASRDGAKARLKKARIDLEYTSIRAPFDGIIEEQSAKTGDYLSLLNAVKTCAKIVKLHPLLVVGDVSERNINQLRVGQKGTATLVTGEKVRGMVRYIASSAKVETRTFRVELEIDNRNNRMRNGVTADIHIPLKASIGHLISPAFLALNDEGEVGVRAVGANRLVKFRPVKILDQGKRGVWVTGLPKSLTIITVGHDYVTDGQKVEVVMEKGKRAGKLSNRGAANNDRS